MNTSGGYGSNTAMNTSGAYGSNTRSGSASTVGGIAGSSTDMGAQRLQTDGVITDPRLASIGVGAKGMIRGTYGDPNRLYPGKS
jgi:hypothetical protein